MTTNTLYHKAKLTIRRADHMGMCFGVRDAIALAKREAAMAPLTVEENTRGRRASRCQRHNSF